MFQLCERWTSYSEQNELRKGGLLNIVTILIIVLVVLAILYFAKRV